MLEIKLDEAIQSAENFKGTDDRTAAQVLLTFVMYHPSLVGAFTCPPTLHKLMITLRGLQGDQLKIMYLQASKTLLETYAKEVSDDTPATHMLHEGPVSSMTENNPTSRKNLKRGMVFHLQ